KQSMYLKALHKGVFPPPGGTEPGEVAFAVEPGAEQLINKEPKQIAVKVSANIRKNAIAVIVPGTGQPGLPIAAAVGYLYGDASKGMKVIPKLTAEDDKKIVALATSGKITVSVADVQDKLYVQVKVTTVNNNTSEVYIAADHTNIYLIKKNGETVFSKERPAVDSLADWELFMQKSSLEE